LRPSSRLAASELALPGREELVNILRIFQALFQDIGDIVVHIPLL
jgi:hypothetical protein